MVLLRYFVMLKHVLCFYFVISCIVIRNSLSLLSMGFHYGVLFGTRLKDSDIASSKLRTYPRVFDRENNENYSTWCHIDMSRLLQNMMRYLHFLPALKV